MPRRRTDVQHPTTRANKPPDRGSPGLKPDFSSEIGTTSKIGETGEAPTPIAFGPGVHASKPHPSASMISTVDSTEIHILEHRLRVANIKKDTIAKYTHALIKISLLPNSRPSFFSFTEAKDGYTVIVEEEVFSELPIDKDDVEVAESAWRVLTISAGAFGSNNLTGISKIVKSVITPLADYSVSVLIISTYQSDYVLVQESDLTVALQCLSHNFKIFQETGASPEQVTLSLGERMAGVFGKQVEESGNPSRPIIHPLVYPLNRYHITSLDSQMLQTLTPLILELMFYSGSRPIPKESYESFFHISIIDGDISLVLETDAISRFPAGSLYTSNTDECWRMIRVGDSPLGFEESGIVAQVSEPLADADISFYYNSTFHFDHQLVPEHDLDKAMGMLSARKKASS